MIGCKWPYRRLFVTVNGYATCPACYLSPDAIVTDKMHQLTPPEVWGNAGFEELRQKTREGDWSWCSMCPKVPDGEVPHEFEPHEWPQEIHLCDSWGCNLKCRPCRKKINADGQSRQVARRKRLFMLMDYFLPHARILKMNGSGEVFTSPMHRELLWSLHPGKYPNLKLCLITNGTLMPKYWPMMPGIHDMMAKIEISIDAAERATYEYLRVGGSWDLVMQSLGMCREMRKSGQLPHLFLRYTLNRRNIHEVEKFIELGREYMATTVNFTIMENWSGSDDSWYEANTLLTPSGMQMLRDLRDSGILDDPLVQAPCVIHADSLHKIGT